MCTVEEKYLSNLDKIVFFWVANICHNPYTEPKKNIGNSDNQSITTSSQYHYRNRHQLTESRHYAPVRISTSSHSSTLTSRARASIPLEYQSRPGCPLRPLRSGSSRVDPPDTWTTVGETTERGELRHKPGSMGLPDLELGNRCILNLRAYRLQHRPASDTCG